MQYAGVITGLTTFALIAVLHVLVVKIEFHVGSHVWPFFAFLGIAFMGASVFASDVMNSVILGITGFLLAWSAPELIKQKERVEKGWYPKKDG